MQKKLVMHMRQAQCDQARMGLSNKSWLDQTSNHYKVVTTMLIHTWNEHLDIQANKIMQITCMPNTQPMHNTLSICI